MTQKYKKVFYYSKKNLLNQLKKAIKKERYLSKEDALLINEFINKIKNELIEAQN